MQTIFQCHVCPWFMAPRSTCSGRRSVGAQRIFIYLNLQSIFNELRKNQQTEPNQTRQIKTNTRGKSFPITIIAWRSFVDIVILLLFAHTHGQKSSVAEFWMCGMVNLLALAVTERFPVCRLACTVQLKWKLQMLIALYSSFQHEPKRTVVSRIVLHVWHIPSPQPIRWEMSHTLFMGFTFHLPRQTRVFWVNCLFLLFFLPARFQSCFLNIQDWF
jgi:hypothetical protein